jgi:alpha-tubulin suppressor-like RCC1 family protein
MAQGRRRCAGLLLAVAACGDSAGTVGDAGALAPDTRSDVPGVPDGGSDGIAREAGDASTRPALLALGRYYSCLEVAGGVRCWGSNADGELGDGTTTDRSSPTMVQGLLSTVEIAPHDGHACARLVDGTMRCWGYNQSGQVGDGTTTGRLAPVAVCAGPGSAQPCTPLSPVVSLAQGSFSDHTCVSLADGTARCWGANPYGQLCNGTTQFSPTPTVAAGLTGAKKIVLGAQHTCALFSDGSVQCAGRNDFGTNGAGALGDGTMANRAVLGLVSSLSGVVDISAGYFHTCAVRMNGSVQCWGGNNYGQLGDGTRTTRLIPVAVAGITNAVAVSAGEIDSCAVLLDGTAACWGTNAYGNLGDGTMTPHLQATPVPGLSGVVAVAAASYHTCALLAGGTAAKCWGDNGWGQLGDGSTTRRLTPTTVVF